MKIGIDGRASKWYRGTGIGTYTYELINYLLKTSNDFNYYVHLPQNITFPPNQNINYIYTKDNGKENFWEEISIPNNIDNLNLDLYHLPQSGIGMPNNHNCPYVITLHDIIPYKLPKTVSSKFLSIFNKYMPNIVENSKAIITVSEFSKEDIAKAFNYDKNKIFVTHLASEDIYKPINKNLSKQLIKENYHIEDNFILYIGGFSPRKNILGLIESFSLLKQKYKKPLKLVIAGAKGISYEIYKNRVDALCLQNDVIFPGFISMEHMPYLYNACECFVYPSFYEGFGLPPIEAMSCGVPVIASNVTSIPEVVKDSAILINPNDVYALTLAIYDLLSNKELQQKLIKSGLKRSAELTWENTINHTISAYKKILQI